MADSLRVIGNMRMRRQSWVIVGLLLLAFWAGSHWLAPGTAPETAPMPAPTTAPRDSAPEAAPAPTPRDTTPEDSRHALLPPEALTTLRRIHAGGPHPHRQDGTVFQNRERLLPQQPRGWYREYTVDTPGLNHRGARRIVTGGDPPREYWYTDDHYRSFTRFDPPAETLR